MTGISAMSMHRAILIASLLLSTPLMADDRIKPGPHLGKPVTEAALRDWDLSIPPDGSGLPPGSGTPAEGGKLYQQYCQACHGPKGMGGSADDLAGRDEPLTSEYADKNVGSYWPYATTLFDWIRRSMPTNAPWSLTADQVYAICAYILSLNDIIPADAVMNAETLPAVRMPNRDGFIRYWPDPGPGRDPQD